MQIITTLDELNQAVLPPSAAALGTFDGLHRGHQKVIHTTRAYAKEHGLLPWSLPSAIIPWLF